MRFGVWAIAVLALAAMGARAPLGAAQTPAAPAASPAQAAAAPAHPKDDYWTKHDQQLLTDFGWLAKFKDADAQLPPPAAGENRVVFMGDSITEGWHLADS